LDGPVSTGRPVSNRRVIHATCSVHGGSRGFTNLAVTRNDGQIVLDPHATGSCVIILDEAATTALFDLLRQWFG
jgi:hypothetical protein